MSTLITTYFGFTAVKEQVPSTNDWAATYWNWITVDTVLNGLIEHRHTGNVALSDPLGSLTLTDTETGGVLLAGVTYYVAATYIDSAGLETGISAIAQVTMPSGLTPPDTPTNNDQATPTDIQPHTGGLTGGSYWYKLTYVKGGGESLPSNALYVVVPSDQTYEVTIHFTSLTDAANGADTIRIYRKIGTSGTYDLIDSITDVNTNSYTNDSPSTYSCSTHPPTTASTNSLNKLEIDCSTLTNYTDATAINLYVSTTGTFNSSNMLIQNPDFSTNNCPHTIDLTDATPGVSIIYTGLVALVTGKPPAVSQTIASPTMIDLTSEVTGGLAWSQMPEEFPWQEYVNTQVDLAATAVVGEVRMVADEFILYGWDQSLATPIWRPISIIRQAEIADVEESATPTPVEEKINEILAALRSAGVIET